MARCPDCGHYHVQHWDGHRVPCLGVYYTDGGGIARCPCARSTTTALPAAA